MIRNPLIWVGTVAAVASVLGLPPADQPQPDPADVIVATVYEPVDPTLFQSEQRIRCSGKTLVISNIGFTLPLGQRPAVTIDGEPVTGPAVDKLLEDLSLRGAEYRFGAGCEQHPSEFLVRIYTIEKISGGHIRYRSARARIKDGRLYEYIGLRETTSFWFRS